MAAATMAGPGTPMALAQVSGDIQADVAAETPSKRAIEVREGGLPLMLGSRGDLVAHLQKALGVRADGIFGGATDTAVRRYQLRAGLRVDGIVGPATWSALFERSSAVGGSNVPPQVKQRIEQKLEAAGQRLDARSSDPIGPQGGLFGGSGDSSADQGSSGPQHSSGGPAGGGDAEDVPAGGRTEQPSAGGGREPSAPVAGGCGSSTIATPVDGTVTSEFGPRGGRNHDGVDIAAPTGTAVRAAACGSVTIAGTQSGYGNIVCITHTSAFSTCYAHLSRFATSQGAQVQQGQVIGYVGCTGSCTGPHLHFETRLDGQAQDPRTYLNGGSVPGRTASTAKASSTAPASTQTASSDTSRSAQRGTTQAEWGEASSAPTAGESMAAQEHTTAQAGIGPTTPTAAPGTPEAMTSEAAPVEAAPPPVETAPAPVQAAPVEAAPAPVEAAPAPVEAAPVEAAPVEAAPAPVEAAPAPVEAAPAPVEATPAPVEAAPPPVETTPVETAPVETAPAHQPIGTGAPAQTHADPAATGPVSGGAAVQ